MSETTTVDQLLRRAHHLLREEHVGEAGITLGQIQAETPHEVEELAYLRAWHCTLQGQWDAAAQFIIPSSLLTEKIADIHELGQTERRRRAHYLLMMGFIAINLGRFDEAATHYLQCIKFLDERRMNDVNLRIKALTALGTIYTQTGVYVAAIEHYKSALELCGEDTRYPDLPDIYYGLCDTYRHLRDYKNALSYGEQALQLYVDLSNQSLEGRMRNMLGNICYSKEDYQNASKYFTEALAIATSENNPMMVVVNFGALADARRSEGFLEEAQRYCQLALNYIDNHGSVFQGNNHASHVKGMAYIACGRVAQTRSEKASGKEADELKDRAVRLYQQAITSLEEIHGTVELSLAYRLLAQILEDSGQNDQAFAYWKRAYAVSSQPD